MPRRVTAVITPHAQRERGKVIGRGVHICNSMGRSDIRDIFHEL